MNMSGVDIGHAIAISQHQIMELIGQIERSANVGIGHAFSGKYVADYLNNTA